MDSLDSDMGIARVAVELGDRSYSILIGSGVLEHAHTWLERTGVKFTHAICVMDSQVEATHGQRLIRALSRCRFE